MTTSNNPDTRRSSSSVRKPVDPRPLALGGLVAFMLFALFMIWPTSPRLPGQARRTAPADATASGKPRANPIVEIETTEGTIRAQLFQDRAPETVKNFVDLVDQGFYDGIVFHRVIPGFMIQTGDPRGNGTGGRADRGLSPKVLTDEFHPSLRHDRAGLLSMANKGPNSGDCQFFITTAPASHLDDKHAIFGEVIDGMPIVRAIEGVPTDKRSDKPFAPPRMIKVRMVNPESDAAKGTKEETSAKGQESSQTEVAIKDPPAGDTKKAPKKGDAA